MCCVFRLRSFVVLVGLVFSLQSQSFADASSDFYRATLSSSENIRTLQGGVLERLERMPEGTVLKIPKNISPTRHQFRDEDGSIRLSSNLFFSGVTVVSVGPSDQIRYPQSRLDEINSAQGGVYVTSLISDDFEDAEIFPLPPQPARSDYLNLYREDGKPGFSYTRYFSQTRFPESLNRIVDPTQQVPSSRKKWLSIMAELEKVANREVGTDPKLLFVPSQKAWEYSRLFEQNGIVQLFGAWAIAVLGTATRHGFENVPCAEFQSEIIRQAYQRAGYSHLEDFNSTKGNVLHWETSAAVEDLANSLNAAGWIPWEAQMFRPKTGAPVMHYLATTPGHTYMAAGKNGRWIIDNGFPRGLDLGTLSSSTIRSQYMSGVFFLPPGIIPDVW